MTTRILRGVLSHSLKNMSAGKLQLTFLAPYAFVPRVLHVIARQDIRTRRRKHFRRHGAERGVQLCGLLNGYRQELLMGGQSVPLDIFNDAQSQGALTRIAVYPGVDLAFQLDMPRSLSRVDFALAIERAVPLRGGWRERFEAMKETELLAIVGDEP